MPDDLDAERAFNERFSGVSRVAGPVPDSPRTIPQPEQCVRCTGRLVDHGRADIAMSSKVAAWVGDVSYTALRVHALACGDCGRVELWSPSPHALRIDTFTGAPT